MATAIPNAEALEARTLLSSTLLADLNRTHERAFPRPAATLDGVAYFIADTEGRRALFRSDGTAEGTRPVSTRRTGPAAPRDNGLERFGDKLFYFGAQPTVTDGTREGTVQLGPIGQGAFALHSVAAVGDRIVYSTFGVDDGHGHDHWISDGTAAGTHPIAALDGVSINEWTSRAVGNKVYARRYHQGLYVIGPSPNRVSVLLPGHDTSGLTEYRDALYFLASTPESGVHLYRTRGTDASTRQIFALDRQRQASRSDIIGAAGDTLVFRVANQLWSTRGTAATTRFIAGLDAEPWGSDTGFPRVAEIDGVLYFRFKHRTRGYEVFRTDGTPGGSFTLTDLPGDDYLRQPEVLSRAAGGLAFLYPRPRADIDYERVYDLYVSDGIGGARPVLLNVADYSTELPRVAEVSGQSMVIASTAEHGARLYQLDEAGRPVELLEFPDGATASGFIGSAGAKLLFTVIGPDSAETLWATDGTANGTVPLRLLNTRTESSSPRLFTRSPSGLYFATDHRPWSGGIDYTPANSGRLWLLPSPDSAPILLSDDPGRITSIAPLGRGRHGDGSVLFVAITDKGQSPGRYAYLWVSDGTPQGTRRLDTFLPTTADIGRLVTFEGVAYAVIDGTRLLRSDGTVAGTRFVSPEPPPHVTLRELTPFKGKLAYVEEVFGAGDTLWMSDGQGNRSSVVSGIGQIHIRSVWKDRLFFTDGGQQLWVTDGTSSGTRRLRTFKSLRSMSTLTAVGPGGNVLYFTATDRKTGPALWRTSGTRDSTVLVADPRPSRADPEIELLGYLADGSVLFTAYAARQERLYRTRPRGGAFPLRRVNPLYLPTSPARVPSATVGDGVVFAASYLADGAELWISDGTASGTRVLAEIGPGPTGSFPIDFTVFGDTLIVSAEDGLHGFEPHAIPLTPSSTSGT